AGGVIAGSLPTGLSLRTDMPSWCSANASAGIGGIATMPGTYGLVLRATSGSQHADQHATLRISGIVLTDLYTLPDAFVGTSYAYTLSAVNDTGPVTWAPNGGLPAGLTLSSE